MHLLIHILELCQGQVHTIGVQCQKKNDHIYSFCGGWLKHSTGHISSHSLHFFHSLKLVLDISRSKKFFKTKPTWKSCSFFFISLNQINNCDMQVYNQAKYTYRMRIIDNTHFVSRIQKRKNPIVVNEHSSTCVWCSAVHGFTASSKS